MVGNRSPAMAKAFLMTKSRFAQVGLVCEHALSARWKRQKLEKYSDHFQ